MMLNVNKDAVSAPSGATTESGTTENSAVSAPEALSAADRTEVIQRMLRDALDEPSAVAANLQINGGDLLEMSLVLKTAIMDAAKSSRDITELKDLQSYIDTFVKLSRQADRILRLKHEITQSPQDSSIEVSAKNRRAGE
jgi:hypothetical protein